MICQIRLCTPPVDVLLQMNASIAGTDLTPALLLVTDIAGLGLMLIELLP